MTVITQEQNSPNHLMKFDRDKIELMKNTICKGSTDDEFQLFLHACQRTGLDPFMKQIHAVKRQTRHEDGTWGESMTIQTAIDGYRLIAERTGRYMPGKEPTYQYNQNLGLISATASVKKLASDGTWHEISATAFYNEYVQRKKNGEPTKFWMQMPHNQLAKCAEALALRKAFPADLSGIYTTEEMPQVEVIIEKLIVTKQQAEELDELIGENDQYRELVMNYLRKLNIDGFEKMPVDLWTSIMKKAQQIHNEKLKQLQENNNAVA